MKRAILVAVFALASAGLAYGQAQVDVLGAHNNNGRGCAGCHQPHSGSRGSGQKGAVDSGNYALWGQDASPLYGKTIAFGDNGTYTETLPATITGGGAEVGGILLCLSCHDGNVTPTNMMTKSSYEQRIGLLTNTAYGSNPIPTLLGNDGTTAGNYNNDHPVGQLAAMVSYGKPMMGSGSGVTFTPPVGSTGGFVAAAGSQYATFIANYGYPSIAPGKWGPQYGVTAANIPYVTCTTCHNQHVMTVFTSYTTTGLPNPINGDGGNGTHYATYFFVNGPYNPNITPDPTGLTAPSTTQFCRQCHFGESNEASGVMGVKTQFN
jgi:hypothetical protein